jgi:hypothetical protein
VIHAGILDYRRFRYLWWALALTLGAAVLFVTQYYSGPPRGSTWQGYTLGTVAALGMVWLALLGIRRRRYRQRGHSVLGWTSAHVYLGVAFFIVATLHSDGRITATVHGMTYLLLLAVVVTGLFGVFIYANLPRAAADNRLGRSRADLFAELLTLDRRARELATDCEPETEAAVVSAIERTVIGGGVLAQLGGADRSLFLNPDRPDAAGVPTLCSNKEQRGITDLVATRIPRGRRRSEVAVLQELLPILFRRQAVLHRIRRDIRMQGLFSVWLYVHVPCTVGMLATLVAHIAIVYLYW